MSRVAQDGRIIGKLCRIFTSKSLGALRSLCSPIPDSQTRRRYYSPDGHASGHIQVARVVSDMTYLYTAGMVHGDLKMMNWKLTVRPD